MKNLTIVTLQEGLITNFAAKRNQALAKANTDWVLFLDSDEVLTPILEDEIQDALGSEVYPAYYIHRLDNFMGRNLMYGETGQAKFVRLARKDWGHWERPVHEVWVGEGKVGDLISPILHTPHESIDSFLAKINHYSSIEADYRYSQGIKSSLFKIAVYPLGKFKLNYIFRLGFLDGVPGMIMAIMMSFHSYLTWTKLYLLWHKK